MSALSVDKELKQFWPKLSVAQKEAVLTVVKTFADDEPGVKKLTAKEKKILTDLDESIEWIHKYEKGLVKAKSINQVLDEL